MIVMRAASVSLDSDEGLWVLVFEDEDGERRGVDVHTLALTGELSTALAKALNDVESWRDPYEPGPGRPDLEGYDLSDPKRAMLENGGAK